MAEVIKMPRLSDTMEEGTVVKWHKNVGDKISEGDILAEIETDKAIQEFESEVDGILLHIGIEEGAAVPVNTVLAIIGEEGEDISTLKSSKKPVDAVEIKEEEEEEAVAVAETTTIAQVEIPKDIHIIKMPRLSDTMEEGTLVRWFKKIDEEVNEGDILAEIETDKAVQEFESEYNGTVLYLGAEEGEALPVETLLIIIGTKGTDVSAFLTPAAQPITQEKVSIEVKVDEKKGEISANGVSIGSGERIFASPLARKIAEDKGIDLEQVKGSGDAGRIVKKDVENYTPTPTVVKEEKTAISTPVSLSTPQGEDQLLPNSQMRKVIAKRLAESKFTAPHYYLNVEFDMDNAILARQQMNALPDTKISFNDMIVKACAMALRKHPQVNSTWSNDNIIQHKDINVGVAVAVEDGLLVPVVKNTDYKSFAQISAEIKDYATRARERKLKADEMDKSTFSISNLGMFGIESFTSIINQPNSCILSVGAIIQKPVVKNGEVVVGNTMKLCLACDHRTVDGATGAQFLQTLKTFIENPVNMLV